MNCRERDGPKEKIYARSKNEA